jgi:hypothetical protein
MAWFLKKDLEQTERDLDHSAICAKHLAVDPTPEHAGAARKLLTCLDEIHNNDRYKYDNHRKN